MNLYLYKKVKTQLNQLVFRMRKIVYFVYKLTRNLLYWSFHRDQMTPYVFIAENGITYFKCVSFVCLFGFNVALKHLRSYHDGACL